MGATVSSQSRNAFEGSEALTNGSDSLVAPAPPPQVQHHQPIDTGFSASPDTAFGRGSRHQRGRGGALRGQRVDGGSAILNRRPQTGQEGNGEGQVQGGVNASQTSRGRSRPSSWRTARASAASITPARRFGGQLTTSDSGGASSALRTILQADAPEFHPGQPHTGGRSTSGSSRQAQMGESSTTRMPRARKGSRSSATDIATRTHEDITNGVYECPICTIVLRDGPIMRGPHSKILKSPKTGRNRPGGSGGVRDATYPKKLCLRITLAGAERR
ncbi:hypothetical protein FGG08_005229 [Glutinoglossum americanum]|uniref:Uncharacterized protein n=1 Tax=Glutinoglossum americanum TaxID=1670608 RepID=A0A9P8L1N0_9PEZI|nr:hypothetical protein FGG08_005229 [Glutinoglossum americanum]